ncbi:MAG TPA: GGDEF domain-containing protein, partial [Clostridia bacterium]|nr:GGDEF domain-containing protein [Clostridia bacterium]
MWIYVGVLVSMGISVTLLIAGKISVDTACLVPMLPFCFVYTPISWFTFDGLMGSTPYLTILFAVMIILTYYHRIQALLLALYAALVAGLTVHWFVAQSDSVPLILAVNTLAAYVITATLIVYFLLRFKRMNLEIGGYFINHAIRDALTGLHSRWVIDPILDIEEKKHGNNKADFCVMMCDVDRFKQINDQYGHNTGDAVLKSLSACIQGEIREKDFAIRFGGDELMVILTELTEESARKILTRMEEAIGRISDFPFPVRMSVGYAMRSECKDRSQLIALADQRMYEKKASTSS